MKDSSPIHHVYLLVDRDHYRFKIGVSIDPVRRSWALRQNFNLGTSVQAGYTRERAYDIERYLHALYSDLNIPRSALDWEDGSTEWFCFDCFPACRRILGEEEPLTPLRRIRPKAFKKKVWVKDYLGLAAHLIAS